MDKPTDLNEIDPAVGYALLSAPPQGGQETPKQNRKRLFWRFMFEQQLAWRTGDTLAIGRAIVTCRLLDEPPPNWLADAIVELVDRRMLPAERRQQTDLAVHMMRWQAVMGLRDPKRWRRTYHHGKPSACDQRRETLLARNARGMSWEKCWWGAAEILDGTEAGGSCETIRTSYKLIKSAPP
jgi:hypothetical protein